MALNDKVEYENREMTRRQAVKIIDEKIWALKIEAREFMRNENFSAFRNRAEFLDDEGGRKFVEGWSDEKDDEVVELFLATKSTFENNS